MSMKSWAEKEIEIACKRENPDWDGESFDYGISCYRSALKAFNTLMKDNHSGYSIKITQMILNRLIDGKPLIPITEEDFNEVSTDDTSQCNRYFSLFKEKDGTYNDIDRVIFCEIIDGKELHSHFGFVSKLVNKMFPITLPYYPSDKPYKVYGEMYTITENGEKIVTPGEFNAFSLSRIVTPDGDEIELNSKYIEKNNTFEEY